MIYIGIDNGTSGSIGIIKENNAVAYLKMPIKKELNYTKSKRWINRIDCDKLHRIFTDNSLLRDSKVIIERPMVNPGRFQATASALRALEAVLIVVERFRISYAYIDSKEWQKVLLPAGLHREELKSASLSVGKRLFPQIDFKGFADADGLLMSWYGVIMWRENIKNEDFVRRA